MCDLTESSSESTPKDGLTPSSSFEAKVNSLLNSGMTTESLRKKAEEYLAILNDPAFEADNIPLWVERISCRGQEGLTITKVFHAMYTGATQVGFPAGSRYAYAATCTCGGLAQTEATLEERKTRLVKELVNLAETWIAYFLWPFRWSSMAALEVPTPSLSATPTYDDTGSELEEGPQTRPSWRDDVSKTTLIHHCLNTLIPLFNFRCFMTGYVDFQADEWPQNSPLDTLHVAHIVKFSSTNFDAATSSTSEIHSITMTLDILKHYVDLDSQTINNLKEILSSPRNALLLQSGMHNTFDRFMWCLISTNVPGQYKVKLFVEPSTLFNVSLPDVVTFEDHSNSGIPLPSPLLLRWHAALAHVFHLSGAAGLFKDLRDLPGHFGPAVPSKSGYAFMEHVIKYDGTAITKHAELVGAVEAMVLSESQVY
ncbi:hypothetical protein L227DRAFT_571333 [Lentinus tigrinus ALCF2SS1-6]|uniref:HNH nuclease domain-containing protein n=1 Tax=Lentinus tigrinus ALCF2SS1-6 TaxID=1328759 RepID=A0A5C2SML4_9APHY|nr:hypothetical protein L227DRAFT_571333 [Lentinus tigrinus ALCF2SS1-6]